VGKGHPSVTPTHRRLRRLHIRIFGARTTTIPCTAFPLIRALLLGVCLTDV